MVRIRYTEEQQNLAVKKMLASVPEPYPTLNAASKVLAEELNIGAATLVKWAKDALEAREAEVRRKARAARAEAVTRPEGGTGDLEYQNEQLSRANIALQLENAHLKKAVATAAASLLEAI